MKNIKLLTNKILELEEKYKLFEKKIDDIYFWKLIRWEVSNEISKKIKIIDSNIGKKNDISKYEMIKKSLKGKIQKQEIEELFFLSDRFFYENDRNYEIYTYKFLENNKNSLAIYPIYTENKYINFDYNFEKFENINLLYSQLKFKIYSKFYRVKTDLSYIEKVKKDLMDYFKVENIDILNIKNIENIILKFKLKKQYFKEYLKIKNPKRIYIICSFGREDLIAAAQELEIEVVEIQHGLITEYDLGYYFPTLKKIPYFPDKIYMFGEYWYKKSRIKLEEKNIKYIGYPYMEKQLKKYKENLEEDSNKILFISQKAIGVTLIDSAIDFAKNNPNKKVIIRLHPTEFNSWKDEYKNLYNNRNLKNLEISNNNNKNLYELLLESRYIISVYSTVIYEALSLKKKVGVIDLQGIEYIEDLVNDKIVYKFKDKIDLKKLEELELKDSKQYFNIEI